MVPVAPSKMVRRVSRCSSKRGTSSSRCSRAFSICWVGEVSTIQYLISINCISHLFGGVSWLHSMGWQGHLLGYYRQLFLHFWQTCFGKCLLGFAWGVIAGSE
jgi:hypothetical protein